MSGNKKLCFFSVSELQSPVYFHSGENALLAFDFGSAAESVQPPRIGVMRFLDVGHEVGVVEFDDRFQEQPSGEISARFDGQRCRGGLQLRRKIRGLYPDVDAEADDKNIAADMVVFEEDAAQFPVTPADIVRPLDCARVALSGNPLDSFAYGERQRTVMDKMLVQRTDRRDDACPEAAGAVGEERRA